MSETKRLTRSEVDGMQEWGEHDARKLARALLEMDKVTAPFDRMLDAMPFRTIEAGYPDDYVVWGFNDAEITMGDLRRLRAARLEEPPNSRSVQRRIAAQKGEPAPQFDAPLMDETIVNLPPKGERHMKGQVTMPPLDLDALATEAHALPRAMGTTPMERRMAEVVEQLIAALRQAQHLLDLEREARKATDTWAEDVSQQLDQAKARIDRITLDNEDLQRRLAGTEEVLRQAQAERDDWHSELHARQGVEKELRAENEHLLAAAMAVETQIEDGDQKWDELQAENERLREQLARFDH